MKTHFGAIVFASVVCGAIEAWIHRPTTPIFMPFQALLYAMFFGLLAVLFVLLGRAVRQERVANAGCSLVLAAVLANCVFGLRGAVLWPLLACAGAGVAWYFVHEYAGLLFSWPVRAHVVIFVGLMLGMLACGYAEKRHEEKQLAAVPAAQQTAPNVLMIISDTTRADHLGVYGYTRPTSPSIDTLAGEGVLFENAVSAAPWTLPSHASMLTGRYPHDHGAVDEFHHYDGRFITLPQYMEQHGYRTAAFSANTFLFTRRVGLGRGFAHFGDRTRSLLEMVTGSELYARLRWAVIRMGFTPDLLGRRSAGDINSEALRWIQDSGTSHPFFVVLNYLDAHDPYLPPEAQRKMFARPGAHAKNVSISDNQFPEMMPADWRDVIDLYDGGINYIDGQVGQMLAQLDAMGLMKNTIVLFTSDHGESFGEHGIETHGSSLYEQQTHVPLMIVWRGHVPAGKRVAQPVSTASIAATVAELATGQSDASFELPALEPLWASAPSSWPAPMSEVVALPLDHFRNHDAPLRSVTTANWYCVVGAGKREVFDHQDRPIDSGAFDQDPIMRAFLGDAVPAGASTVAKSDTHARVAGQ